jgi:hypothetical protein
VQCLGSIYIRLLPSLRAATEQNYESVAILGQIDPVPRAPVDDTLSNACEPFATLNTLHRPCGVEWLGAIHPEQRSHPFIDRKSGLPVLKVLKALGLKFTPQVA